MRERDRQNKQRRKGFTLAELLVVVAIIGVLVGVAIPVLNTQLEKAREIVDISNMRHAKEAGILYFMGRTISQRIDWVYYEASTGNIFTQAEYKASRTEENVANNATFQHYGKGTEAVGITVPEDDAIRYATNADVRDCIIMVVADYKGNVACGWINPEYALQSNPFGFLAIDSEGHLRGVRAASDVNTPDAGLKQMDDDVRATASKADNMKIMNKILKLYYGIEFEQIDLYMDTIFSLKLNDPNRNYYRNTVFSKVFNDAEGALLAFQFWAAIAEMNAYKPIDNPNNDQIINPVTNPTNNP